LFLFDWKKVYDTAEGNVSRCNMIMEMLIKKQIPNNKYDPIYSYSQMSFTGISFMLHPDVLLFNSYKYSTRDISVYYALASLRSLPEYVVSQKTTLDVLHLPVPLETITQNRLLRIDGDNIHFLYEEVTQENTH
jgi:hypothetical protein